MNQDLIDEQTFCPKHNLLQEVQIPSTQQLACAYCLAEIYNLIPIQYVRDNEQSNLKKIESLIQSKLNILNHVIGSLKQLIVVFNKGIKAIIQIIEQIEKETSSIKNQMMSVFNYQTLLFEKKELQLEQYLTRISNLKMKILFQIDILHQNQSLNKIVKQLKEMDQIAQLKDQQIQIHQPPQIKHEYQLLKNSTIKQQKYCKAIAFNKDASIVVAGCETDIHIYEFQNEILRETEIIQGLSGQILCLQFMKKRNLFISGSLDKLIKLWEQNEQKQWINIQTLQRHTSSIECLMANLDENEIFSGSNDALIVVWKLSDFEWNFDQIIACSSQIRGLSINNSNNKLISFELNQLISIFELQRDTWIIAQKIKVENKGAGISFINDYEFVFLPQNDNCHFFNFDMQSNKFQKGENQIISNQKNQNQQLVSFVKSFNLLIVKQANCMNIFRVTNSKSIILDQSIEFEFESFCGNVSSDGQYLMIQKYITQELQVRKLKKVE